MHIGKKRWPADNSTTQVTPRSKELFRFFDIEQVTVEQWAQNRTPENSSKSSEISQFLTKESR